MEFSQNESIVVEDKLETAKTTEATEAEKIEELRGILTRKKEEKGPMVVQESVVNYVKLLIQAFGRDVLEGTKMYHLLIDSGFNDELSPEFDLPGGRIERFIRERL